jgi:hypothetical protein
MFGFLVWLCLVEDTPCNAHYDFLPSYCEPAHIVLKSVNREHEKLWSPYLNSLPDQHNAHKLAMSQARGTRGSSLQPYLAR